MIGTGFVDTPWLRFHDRNNKNDIVEPEFHMETPPLGMFRDVHDGFRASFPPITPPRLQEYLAQYNKELDSKCKDMYKQRYLRCFRLAAADELVFIRSVVWAEMKSSASYQVDVSLDQRGVVQQSQCECGAGQGPNAHCKHVVTVLYAAVNFVDNGNVLCEETCTQVLQTFHKAKPFKGSPLKADNIQDVRGKLNSFDYDPRPVEYRNKEGYSDFFRNACINHRENNNKPVMQLFPPANPKALALDHDYLEATPQDTFLKKEKISHILPEEASLIETDTRGQSTSLLWKEERSKRLTSSHFGTICKSTERRDRDLLAVSFTSPKNLRVPAVLHGIKYESVAIEQFCAKYDVSVLECGLCVYVNHPFLAASPDRLLGDDTVVEVKCPFSSKDQMISPVTVPYLCLKDNVLCLKENHDYFYQVQGQMMCTERSKCKFIVFTLQDMVVVDVTRNDEFIGKMLSKLMHFYNDHFKMAVLEKFMYHNYHNFEF